MVYQPYHFVGEVLLHSVYPWNLYNIKKKKRLISSYFNVTIVFKYNI